MFVAGWPGEAEQQAVTNCPGSLRVVPACVQLLWEAGGGEGAVQAVRTMQEQSVL